MWKGLTYKKKVYVIFVGFILFIGLAYKLAFSKTIEGYSQIHEKEEKLKWLKEKEKEIPLLQAQMKMLDQAYNGADSSSIRDNLTAFISDFADNNGCTVTEIPKNSGFSNDQFKIQTNKFTIKGNFYNLVKLLNLVEQKYNLTAKVMSVKFFSIKDMQSKRNNLFLTIITQSFRQNESQ